MRSLSSCGSDARTNTVSLFQPCTVTLPTMFTMRKAPSIPNGSRRSTFFWASAGVAAREAATTRPRKRLAATRHLGCAAQQIDLLPVVRGEQLDQNFIRRITSERVSRLEDRLIDRAQTRS